ncbi:MAG TPA: hypothetical protein VN956_24045 [Pyrinomonadaceae bacterium]|nr:hypothetical protein [Pyrinomonadaceae bacterium]
MPKITNAQIVDSLWTATENGRVDWQPTATKDQFAASFGGKWTVVIDKTETDRDDEFWLDVRDSEGQTIVRVAGATNPNIPDLFEMARRRGLKVDESLADFLKEIDSSSE